MAHYENVLCGSGAQWLTRAFPITIVVRSIPGWRIVFYNLTIIFLASYLAYYCFIIASTSYTVSKKPKFEKLKFTINICKLANNPSLFEQFEILVENRRFLMKMEVRFQFSTLPKSRFFGYLPKKLACYKIRKKMPDQGQHRQGLLGLVFI